MSATPVSFTYTGALKNDPNNVWSDAQPESSPDSNGVYYWDITKGGTTLSSSTGSGFFSYNPADGHMDSMWGYTGETTTHWYYTDPIINSDGWRILKTAPFNGPPPSPPGNTGTEGVNTPYVTWHFPNRSCGETTYVSVTHTEATTNATTYTVHDSTGQIGTITVGTASDATSNFNFTISARTLQVKNASGTQVLSTRVFTCGSKKRHSNFW